jgi:CRP-like cAMP-binding protein
MKERFEGEGQPALVDALKNHQLILGDREIADAFLSVGTLQEFSKGTALITEGTETSDVFLLIAGSVGVVVKSNEVATRRAGEPVGEMAAIEPQPRAASVVAQETVVALKVSAPAFLKIGDDYPRMWKAVAKILARRLLERNKLITAPNNKPRLFVISSAEALATARALQDALARDVLVQVWTDARTAWLVMHPDVQNTPAIRIVAEAILTAFRDAA